MIDTGKVVRVVEKAKTLSLPSLASSSVAMVVAVRFHNYCFEIELTDNVTYSYKITPGVARDQNATYLL